MTKLDLTQALTIIEKEKKFGKKDTKNVIHRWSDCTDRKLFRNTQRS